MNAALDLADRSPNTAAGAAPKPVKLRTARDYSLTTTALEHRAEDLEKLSKKTKEEGYHAEARTIDGDVGAIREIILPLFKEQRELPLVTNDDLEATVKNALHAVIHRFAVSSDSAARADRVRNVGTADAEPWQGKRELDLSAAIGRAVTQFAVEIAESSYAAGLAARNDAARTGQALVVRAHRRDQLSVPKPKHRTTASERRPSRSGTFIPAGTRPGDVRRGYKSKDKKRGPQRVLPQINRTYGGSQSAHHFMRDRAATSLRIGNLDAYRTRARTGDLP